MTLEQIIHHLANALKAVDTTMPIEGNFQPGIGPHTEDHARDMAINHLRNQEGIISEYFQQATSVQYPGSREMCDIVIPNEWAIELKLLRPFGDNDKEAEHWSNKILHPYYGNKSAAGDVLKLLDSGFKERKAIILFSYEHDIPQIDVTPTIKTLELILSEVHNIKFKPSVIAERRDLVHPVFQVLKIIGWELEDK
jgi:hypothetical protein